MILNMEFKGQNAKFVETSQVKEGVVCDVYRFEGDNTKDLGVVNVSKGFKTPLQKIIFGDKTIEIFKEGAGQLTVTDEDGNKHVYEFPGGPEEVEVKIGETMQWEATEDLMFIEVCYPPYKEGRFLNIEN